MVDYAVYEFLVFIGRFFFADYIGVDPASMGFFMFVVFLAIPGTLLLTRKGLKRRV